MLFETECLEHALLPKASSALVRGVGKDNAQSHNAFHRTGDKAKGECMCMILVPGLHIKGKKG